MNKILKQAFYSTSTGFSSADKLYKRLKPTYPELTLKEVKEFVKNQYTSQVNAPIRKQKKFNSIIAYHPKECYQMDIMVYDRYAFNNYKYILVIVDVYSRYAQARAMTTRAMSTVMKNIKDIMDEMGIPKNINCDNEFNKHEFNKYAQDNKITMHYSQPDELNKNAIVERLNYTISSRIMKWRTGSGRYDWNKVLPEIMDNYNTDYHSTIKTTPYDVFFGKDVNHQTINKVDSKFNVGDRVRLRIEKKVFGKSDVLKYSQIIYLINKIKGDKIYLTNTETQTELKTYVKPAQLKSVGDIQYIDQPEKEHAPVHKEIQKERKMTRVLNKEGIQKVPELRRSARERKPNQLISDEGERIIW
jgi:hypothetical protein